MKISNKNLNRILKSLLGMATTLMSVNALALAGDSYRLEEVATGQAPNILYAMGSKYDAATDSYIATQYNIEFNNPFGETYDPESSTQRAVYIQIGLDKNNVPQAKFVDSAALADIIGYTSLPEGVSVSSNGTTEDVNAELIGIYESDGSSIEFTFKNALGANNFTGDVIGNYSDYKGIFVNEETMQNLTGNFILNEARSNNAALNNNAGKSIATITGDFIGNAGYDASAIHNKGTIASVTGDFIANSSYEEGAVINTGLIGFLALNDDILFTGNKSAGTSNDFSTYIAIINTGTDTSDGRAKVRFNAYGDHTITLNDAITSTNTVITNQQIIINDGKDGAGANIDSNGVEHGTVIFNNRVENQQILLGGGTLILGSIADSESFTGTSALIKNSSILVSDGATLKTKADYIDSQSAISNISGTVDITGGTLNALGFDNGFGTLRFTGATEINTRIVGTGGRTEIHDTVTLNNVFYNAYVSLFYEGVNGGTGAVKLGTTAGALLAAPLGFNLNITREQTSWENFISWESGYDASTLSFVEGATTNVALNGKAISSEYYTIEQIGNGYTLSLTAGDEAAKYYLDPVMGTTVEKPASVVNYTYDSANRTWTGTTSNVEFNGVFGEDYRIEGISDPYYYKWANEDGIAKLVVAANEAEADVMGYTTSNNRFVADATNPATGEINISNSFFGVTGNGGGAIRLDAYNAKSITSDFVANKSNGEGGAIYALGSNIESIVGNFVGNESTKEGGAIFFRSNWVTNSIGKIEGDFIGNIGGNGSAIYLRGANIGTIHGDFVNNYSTGHGAIHVLDASHINEIEGNFIGNIGGAIFSNLFASIGSIKGNFIGNKSNTYEDSTTGIAISGWDNSLGIDSIEGDFIGNIGLNTSGAAISNIGRIINSISGNFIGNEVGKFGGAIANMDGIMGLLALHSDMVFLGNSAKLGTDTKVSNAILNGGTAIRSGELHFNAYESFQITVNDGISGYESIYKDYQILHINSGLNGSSDAIFADAAQAKEFSKVNFNNVVQDQSIIVYGGTLELGYSAATSYTVDGVVHNVAASSAMLINSDLEIKSSAKVRSQASYLGTGTDIVNAGVLELHGEGNLGRVVTGSGQVHLDAAAQIEISLANSYSGGSYLNNAAEVIVGHNEALGTGGVHLDNATLNLQSGVEFDNDIYILGNNSQIKHTERAQIKGDLYIGSESSGFDTRATASSFTLENVDINGNAITISTNSRFTLADSSINANTIVSGGGDLLLTRAVMDNITLEEVTVGNYTNANEQLVIDANIYTMQTLDYAHIEYQESLTLNVTMSDEIYAGFLAQYNLDASLIALHFENLVVDASLLTIIINGDTYSDINVGRLENGDTVYHFDSIPEPSTATLSLLALAGLLARRRRKMA